MITRKPRIRLAIAFLAYLAFLVPQAWAEPTAPRFGAASLGYLLELDALGPRPAGTAKEKAAADYIVARLEALGYAVERRAFTREALVKKERILVSSENLVCVKAGASDREFIAGAHYDSAALGRGADDNASGVALLLETCASVKDMDLPYTVRFVFFGAEELGTVGSEAYVEGMSPAELAGTIAMLNFDSLIAGDKIYVHGDAGEAGKVRDWMLGRAALAGLPLQAQSGRNPDYPAGTTGDWGDQEPFRLAGVPYAAFEATNWDLGDFDGYTQTDPKYGEKGQVWHSRYDTAAYIGKTFRGRIEAHLAAYAELLYACLLEYE